MVNFNQFMLGINHASPVEESKSSKKNFKKKISVEQAIQAVSGNFFKKLIARLKLAYKNREWFNEKNIKARVASHDLKDLKTLSELFKTTYSTSSKENISNFMDKFVLPARDLKAREQFMKDLAQNERPEIAGINIKYILRLQEKNINAVDLMNDGRLGELKEAKKDTDIDNLIKDFLGDEFISTLKEFTNKIDLDSNEFINLPYVVHMSLESRKFLTQLNRNGITLERIFPDTITTEEILDFISWNAANSFYETIKRFTDQEDIQIALLKSSSNSPERLLIPALVSSGIAAADFTNEIFPTLREILYQARDLEVQRHFIKKILIDQLPEKERVRLWHSIEFFFNEPFKSNEDLALIYPLLEDFNFEAAELIDKYVNRDEDGSTLNDFEKLKCLLNGQSILEAIKAYLNNK